MSAPNPPVLRAESVTADGRLHGVSLAIEPATFTLLSGDSDSGAGTLLRILGLLERPGAGEVWLDGRATGSLDEIMWLDARNRSFGYLFAEPFLLESFSVAENVGLPLFKIADMNLEQARGRAGEVLSFAGLSSMAEAAVNDLTPAECHRVALARALAIRPRALIAEAAGLNLPTNEQESFAALLREVAHTMGIAVIATSGAGMRSLGADCEVRLERGVIASESAAAQEEAPAHE
jgi:lipoprotein-releasing system ATP-binding protein